MTASELTPLVGSCSRVSQRASSAALVVDSLYAPRDNDRDGPGERLSRLSAQLNRCAREADRLGAALCNGPVMSPVLQDLLPEILSQGEGAMGAMTKQLTRLADVRRASSISTLALQHYDSAMAGMLQGLSLLVDLLSMPTVESQDAKLSTRESVNVLEQARSACGEAISVTDILAKESSSTRTDLPPPYEDVPPPPFHAGPSSLKASKASNATHSGSTGFGDFKIQDIRPPLPSNVEPLVAAFCQAASQGAAKKLRSLISQGVNVNGRDEHGNTALICAVRGRKLEAVQFLLNVDGLDHRRRSSGAEGKPPIYHAVETGDRAVIDALLSRGVDLNEKTTTGQPFIFEVISSGTPLALIELLLSRGVDVNCKDKNGMPLIVYAVRRHDLPLTKALLGRGANPNSKDTDDSNVLSIVLESIALSAADKETYVEKFLHHGLDANARGSGGVTGIETALAVAADEKGKGNDPILTLSIPALLIRHGADANRRLSKRFDETTLLHYAIESGNDKLVRVLLSHGANPNVADRQRRTPLVLALRMGRDDLAELLRHHGAA